MQRIKSITLKNFKFFYGDENSHQQNKIEIDRKHLLLYGENGSGKSSVYWALYTFLQSSLKDDDNEIYKYFKHDDEENLRNFFCQDSDESGITIHFEDENKVPQIREISTSNINTKTDTFIRKTLEASDFFNYKYLSKVYDFRNSEIIDLFPLFEKELLMFIDLGEEYKLHNGALSGNTNAADWWTFISEEFKNLPKNTHKVSLRSEEYKRFTTETIPRFNELIKSYLLKITPFADELLKTEFKESLSIKFDVESIKCDFNVKIPDKKKARDGILHVPQIPLHISFDHQRIPENKRKLKKPHIFVNEARLTAIALAIRLAMLEEKLKDGNVAQVLVLDDLLISLDMSNRDTVLDILLEKRNEFQILLLTHDKLFFEFAKHKIKRLYPNDNHEEHWKYLEMYTHEDNDVPIPVVYPSVSYLGKAKKYFELKEYEIAGNLLRKEAENFCKAILPRKKTVTGEGYIKNLDGLLFEAKTYFTENGLDTTNIDEALTQLKFLLNAASHDSFDVPKFSNSIKKCMDVLDKLNRIKHSIFRKR